MEARGATRSVRCQLSSFGRRTTIHGVSHMYQTKSRRRRGFWFVVFLLGFVATVIHLTFHAIQFLESPTMVTMEHEGAEFEFPDVTICPQTPTTRRLYERGTKLFPNVELGLTASEFLLYPLYNQTYDAAHSLPYGEEILLHKRLIQHQLASGPTQHKGLELRDLVISCSFHKEDCRGNFTLLQHPNYINCYTFRPQERQIKTTNPEDGLVLLLYAASKHKAAQHRQQQVISGGRRQDRRREEDTGWFARLLVPEHEPAGVKVIVHEKDSFPSPRSAGFIVGPGRFAEVEITMLQEVSMNRVGAPCLEVGEPKSWLLASVDARGWPEYAEYNAEPGDCRYEAKQCAMYKECGCTSHYLPISSSHRLHADLPHGDAVGWCYNATGLLLSLGLRTGAAAGDEPQRLVRDSRRRMSASDAATGRLVADYRRRLECHDRLLRAFGNPHYSVPADCDSRCRAAVAACRRNVYRGVYSSAEWPRHSDIQEIVEDTILPALRLPDGAGYQLLADDIFDFWPNGSWSSTADIVAGNFVKLQLHPHSVKANMHMQEPAYSIWEALGELGGIFGLWLGVSFLGVIELLEFLVDLAASTRQAQKTKEKATASAGNGNNGLVAVAASAAAAPASASVSASASGALPLLPRSPSVD